MTKEQEYALQNYVMALAQRNVVEGQLMIARQVHSAMAAIVEEQATNIVNFEARIAQLAQSVRDTRDALNETLNPPAIILHESDRFSSREG
jgi:hypothetical protein